MKEAANPKSAGMIAGSFICILGGAMSLAMIPSRTVGGILFLLGLMVGLTLLICGLIVSWRSRNEDFEFEEPSGKIGQNVIRAIRLLFGTILTIAGLAFLYFTFTLGRESDSPVMGFIWGVGMLLFGIKGIRSGLKNKPNQPPQTRSTSGPV